MYLRYWEAGIGLGSAGIAQSNLMAGVAGPSERQQWTVGSALAPNNAACSHNRIKVSRISGGERGGRAFVLCRNKCGVKAQRQRSATSRAWLAGGLAGWLATFEACRLHGPALPRTGPPH